MNTAAGGTMNAQKQTYAGQIPFESSKNIPESMHATCCHTPCFSPGPKIKTQLPAFQQAKPTGKRIPANALSEVQCKEALAVG